MKYGNLTKEEQETIINRSRVEGNILFIYTSDRKVLNRINKSSELRKHIKKHYFDKEKCLVAISLEVGIRDFKKSVFFPYFSGDSDV